MKNWQTKKLGEVCELIMGQSPDGSTYNTGGIGIPLINGPVEFGHGHFSKTIKSKFTTAPTKLCKEGDLILCVRGSTTGRTNIAGFDACIGRGVAAIRYTKYQAWINHYINSIRAKIYKLGTGSTFPNISSAILANLLVPLPPLPEQKRIVAILDEAFTAIATAEEIAEKNLQNARELFESYLQNVFANPGYGWEEKTLGEVCSFEGGSQPSKDYFIYDNREGYIRLIQIRDYKTEEKKVYIPIEKAKRFCDEKEIMIGRYGPPVFQILRGIKGAYNVALMKAIPNEKIIEREFMFFYLQHRGIQQYIINLSQRAVGQTGISREDLEAYPIYFPNIKKQSEIAIVINALSAETKKLEAIYQQKLVDLDELKKSVLEKAFEGEL